MDRAFADLHCHTSRQLRLAVRPKDMLKAAHARGLTHLAITDHDRIDGALEAREVAPAGLTVIVGEEVKTADGDLICLFLERAIAPGLPAVETIAEVRATRAGWSASRIRSTASRRRCSTTRAWRTSCRWSTGSRRTTPGCSAMATTMPRRSPLEHRLPGIAVSDAHSVMEVGVAYTAFDGDPSTAAGLLACLRSAEIIPGARATSSDCGPRSRRASIALRGNRRVAIAPADRPGSDPEPPR